MNANEIEKYLQEHLSKFRYRHSLSVAKETKKLAKLYHLDEERAYLAGLAHDVARDFDEEQNLFYAKKYNLADEYLDNYYSKILHSKIGALVAKEQFSFDEEMCRAIEYHTIGNPKMNIFQKIIFIADKIGRENLDGSMEKVKEFAYQGNLDQALIRYFDILRERLKAKQRQLHPDSLELIQLLRNNVS